MKAVMFFSRISILIFFNACTAPYHRHKFFAVIMLLIKISFS